MNRIVVLLFRAASPGAWVVRGALLLPLLAYFADVLPGWPSQNAGKLALAAATTILQMAVISVVVAQSAGGGSLRRHTFQAVAVTGACFVGYVVLITMFTISTEYGRIVTGFSYANENAVAMAAYYGSDLEALRNNAWDLERLWSTSSLAVTRLSLMSAWFGLATGSSYLIGMHVPHQATPSLPPIDRRVFISYRRSDSADVLGRIHDRLVERIDHDNVFKDVDSIAPGAEFPRLLREAVVNADVMLCVIGPDWETVADADGNARLASKTDFVNIEIRTALEQGIPTIPVLVGRDAMPPQGAYPAPLAALGDRNGIRVRPDPDFTHDVDRLLEAIEGYPRQSDSVPVLTT